MLDDKQMDALALKINELTRAPRSGKTFGELAEGWISRLIRECSANERRHITHMVALANLREGELTKGKIEEVFRSLVTPHGTLAPVSVNKLRSAGRLVIRDAQGNGEWHGPNPFDLVRRLKEAKPLYSVLTFQEFARVLPHLRPDRRRLAKTIFLAGLRPGEAFGLRKEDVDLERKLLKVRRSHGRNQTKTGKAREFPIPDALVEDLREAMAESPSALVFPKADGTRQRHDTKLTRTFRVALAAAGLVRGHRYICRRKGCGFKEEREPPAVTWADCPSCGMRLLAIALPIPLRFYDLRHSSNTAHRQAGADPTAVKIMMGHAASDVNDDRYTHFDEAFMRRELNKLGELAAPLLGGGQAATKEPLRKEIETLCGGDEEREMAVWVDFWRHADELDLSGRKEGTTCYVWRGPAGEDGRPLFRMGAVGMPAEDVAWAYFRAPGGMQRTCDRSHMCIRPEHHGHRAS